MEKENQISDQELSNTFVRQKFMKSILEECGACAVIFNGQGKVLYFNNQFLNLTNFSADLIHGSFFHEVFPFFGDFGSILNKIKDGSVFQIEATDYFFSKIKSGKLRGSINPLVQEGEFKYALGLFHQIKDIDLLEVKISEQNSILSDIEKLSGIGYWETNLKGGTTVWSEGIYRIFEIPLEQPIKQGDFHAYVHPEDMVIINTINDDIKRLKVPQNFEYRIITPARNLKYLSGKVKPVCDQNGEVIKLIGYCQDISRNNKIISDLNTTLSFLLQSQATARIGSFEWDIQSQSFKATPEFYKIFEFEQGEEAGYDKLFERIHEHDRVPVQECIQKSINEPATCELAFKIIPPSGKEIYCLCRAELVEDPINKTKKFIGSIGDITQRRLTEMKLLEANAKLEEKTDALKKLNDQLENKVAERAQEIFLSNERFRLIAEATQEAMWDWDVVNQTLWHNEALNKKFGFHASTKTSHMEMWKSRLHPDDSERVLHGIFRAIDSEDSNWKDSYRFLGVDGKYIFVLDRGFIIRDKDGKAIRMVGSMMEVSKINEIEKRLRESEENYRFLAESMPQLLWICNSKAQCMYANSKWIEYTGQDFGSYRDYGWQNAIYPEDISRTMEVWSDVDRIEMDNEITMQHRILNKNGQARWFLSRAVPMRNEDGKIQRWVGTSTDIHDQKQMEDKLMTAEKDLNNANALLNRKYKRLKNINKDLDNFVYSATHDLRSPISNVEALLKLLYSEAMETPSSEKFTDYFKLVFKSMDIINVILNDLTEVVKVDDDQYPGVGSLSFMEVLDEVKGTLHDSINSSGAGIHVDFEVPTVNFLRKNLRSIFYNLLSNSIKYRSEARTLVIHINTKGDNEYTILSISDNGIGIREKDIEKVFLPFKRINYEIEGTGIGMWIMKRIIENSGGKIEVDSVLDKGTTFRIYFKNLS